MGKGGLKVNASMLLRSALSITELSVISSLNVVARSGAKWQSRTCTVFFSEIASAQGPTPRNDGLIYASDGEGGRISV